MSELEVPDRYARCTRQFINLWQSQEARKLKYLWLRQHGLSAPMAHRLRDWRWEFIDKYFAYVEMANKRLLEKIAEEES